MWISTIDATGVVNHYDWTDNWSKLRAATGTSYPGYMIHEAVNWSSARNSWVILPRRVSSDAYDEEKDEKMGSNTGKRPGN
jgi:soluble calcium-activated nucleotidase 1